jgi:cyclic pyranopterin phosphate synthase
MSITLGMPTIPIRLGQPQASDRPAAPGLLDRFGRTATDLRISLTDKCNLPRVFFSSPVRSC